MTNNGDFTMQDLPQKNEEKDDDLPTTTKAERGDADRTASQMTRPQTLREKTARRKLKPTRAKHNLDVLAALIQGLFLGSSLTFSFFGWFKTASLLGCMAIALYPLILLMPKGDLPKFLILAARHTLILLIKGLVVKDAEVKQAERQDESLAYSILQRLEKYEY